MIDREKRQGTTFNLEDNHGGAPGDDVDDAGRARVLVVEDNADTRTLIDLLLRKSFDVHSADNAEEGLKLASTSHFDVVLVDINLGKGKTGKDVLHAVKSLPDYGDTPVVAVTAYAMPGDRERFVSEGFDGYVAKPFTRQQLLEALERVLA